MKIKNLRADQYFSFFFCVIFLLIQGGLTPTPTQIAQAQLIEVTLVDIPPVPVLKQAITTDVNFNNSATNSLDNTGQVLTSPTDSLLPVTALSYVVIDYDSATVLLEQFSQVQTYPASCAKLMTALVARELYNLDEIVTIAPDASVSGHVIGLKATEQIRVRELFKATLVSSGNDAAQALADYYLLGEEAFVDLMNQKAVQLSLTNTYFTNPTGLDDFAQLTTSWDLALLAKEVLKDPFLSELVSLPQTQASDTLGLNNYQLWNTNQFLSQYSQAKGIKTGTTELAGQVLITLWQDNGHSLLIVVMGSLDRYQDTLTLLNWVNTNIEWKSFNSL